MKRCPDCRRDYYDDSLMYCLDDGAALLEGPASGSEPATAILSHPEDTQTRVFDNGVTRDETIRIGSRRNVLLAAAALGVLVLAVAGAYWYYGGRTENQINAIAVLPFVNESGDPEIEYLSDGMTETLISSLSTLPNMSVKARSSVFRYKGREIDPKAVGRELNVQAFLNGRVLQRAGELTLHVELVDTATENVLWRSSYIRPLANLVALQSEIARDVSTKLRSKLTGEQQNQVAKNHTQNAEAYRLYLQGRFHWNKRRAEEHLRAIQYFEQAIALDPNYALAYSGIADCYAVGSSPLQGDERYAKLQAAGNKALELDPSLGEPHAALAAMGWSTYDWGHSEREYKAAIQLNPNYATAHQWYAELLTRLGRHDEAIAEIKRALELDPLSLIINSDAIYIYAYARRYDESIEQAKKTLEMDNTWDPARFLLYQTYVFKGMYEEALAQEEIANQMSDRTPERKKAYSYEIEAIRTALLSNGSQGFFRKNLEFEEADLQRGTEFSYMYLAELYAAVGETDKAIEMLSKAIDTKDPDRDLIKVNPLYDGLRSDPRFAELLRKMNLAA